MFLEAKSTKKLQELAKDPFDLTIEGNLSPKRVKRMSASACGLTLLYSTERITEEVLDNLLSLSKETGALEKMRAMQSGEKINISENQSVAHTDMRGFFENPSNMALKAKAECDKLKIFLEKNSEKFTDIVLIGIGGSYLGPKALYLALEAYSLLGKRAHFISNVDPDDAARVLKNLELENTLVVVVSKSGTTLETLSNETIVREKFEKSGLDTQKHFVAVTGEGSPMDSPEKYLESFYMWSNVGGRFSSTSMVGGVLLGFMLGFDNFIEILKGANAMDKVALSEDNNLPLLAALLGIWNFNFLKYQSVAVVPYSQAMERFVAHLQQCDMESNGKSIDKNGNFVKTETGPIIWGESGTDSQHSFHQLLHQGTIIAPVEFIGFKESQYEQDVTIDGTTSQQKLLANLFAQSIALAEGKKNKNLNKFFPGNRPSRMLLAKKLTPRTMGKILAFYEHKIAFQGFLWNINSFDQEGVVLGKVLASSILDLWKGNGSFPLAQSFIDYL